MPESTSYRHALLIVPATACWGGGTVSASKYSTGASPR